MDCASLHHFEVRGGNLFQEIQVGIVPAIVGRSANEDSAAVVGQYQTVLLHSGQNHLIIRGMTGNIEGGLEAKAKAHGRSIRIRGG